MSHDIVELNKLKSAKNLALFERNECVKALAKIAGHFGYQIYLKEFDKEELQALELKPTERYQLTIDLPTGAASWIINTVDAQFLNFPYQKIKNTNANSMSQTYKQLEDWANSFDM